MQNQLKDSEEIIVRRIARRLDRYLLEQEKRIHQNKVIVNTPVAEQFQPESNATLATIPVALERGDGASGTKQKSISLKNSTGTEVTKAENITPIFSQNELSSTIDTSEHSPIKSEIGAKASLPSFQISSEGAESLGPKSTPPPPPPPPPPLSSKGTPIPENKKKPSAPITETEKNSTISKATVTKTKSKKKSDPFREFVAEKSADSRVDLLFTENDKKGINLSPLTKIFIILLALIAAAAVCLQLWEYFYYS